MTSTLLNQNQQAAMPTANHVPALEKESPIAATTIILDTLGKGTLRLLYHSRTSWNIGKNPVITVGLKLPLLALIGSIPPEGTFRVTSRPVVRDAITRSQSCLSLNLSRCVVTC